MRCDAMCYDTAEPIRYLGVCQYESINQKWDGVRRSGTGWLGMESPGHLGEAQMGWDMIGRGWDYISFAMSLGVARGDGVGGGGGGGV